jgi:hypothetical protein
MDSWDTFWQNVLNGFAGGYVGGQLSTEQALGNAQVRASGINPSTGTFITPQYADTFTQVNPGVDLSTFITGTRQQTTNDYLATSEADFDALGGFSILPLSPVIGGDAEAISSLIPTIPGLPDYSGVVIVVILIAVAFLVLKAVK